MRGRQPWISELLPDPATPVTRHEHAERHIDRDVLQVVQAGVADRDRAGRLADVGLELLADRRGARRSGSRSGQPVERALVDDLAAVRAGPRSHVDDVVGDAMTSGSCSTTSTVLPLSRSCWSSVHLLDVVGVQADRRLVEDVGHVGQRRAQVANHPRPLRLAAGKGGRLAIEAQVAEPDRHEVIRTAPSCRTPASRRLADRPEPRRRGR